MESLNSMKNTKVRKDSTLNATKEKVLEQIEKYGPVSAKAVASSLGITEQQVMQRISYMVSKKNVNIQKEGPRIKRQYFYDSRFPLRDTPIAKETISEKEADDLFDGLNKDEEQIAPMREETAFWPVSAVKAKGLNLLVNRCHHLVLALENCSSNTIMDSFNLNEEQARILMNKVVAKFGGMHVSFCINVIKEKK